MLVDDASGSSGSRVWYDGIAWSWVDGRSSGEGCGSPAPALVPDASARPVLGGVARASVLDVPPTAVAVLHVGLSERVLPSGVPLPLDLARFGMPGCALRQSAEFPDVPLAPAANGRLEFSLTVPADSRLVGIHLYLQALASAPRANRAGVVVSKGLDWQVGR